MNERVFEGRLAGELAPDDRERRERLKAVARGLARAVRDGLERDGLVRIHGFGTFRLRPVAARTGRHPRTGRRIRIPAGRRVMFRPAKALRERVDPGPAAAVPLAEPRPSREAMLGARADAPTPAPGVPASPQVRAPRRAAAAAMPERVETTRGPRPPGAHPRAAAKRQPAAASGAPEAASAPPAPPGPVRSGDEPASAADRGVPTRTDPGEHAETAPAGRARRRRDRAAAGAIAALLSAVALWWAWPSDPPGPPAATTPDADRPAQAASAAGGGTATTATSGTATAAGGTSGAGATTATRAVQAGTAEAPSAGDRVAAEPVFLAAGGAASAPVADRAGGEVRGGDAARDGGSASGSGAGTGAARDTDASGSAAQKAPGASGEGGAPWFAATDYRVRAGDTLWAVARTHYVNPYYWPHIWRRNEGIADPNRIEVGQALRLPPLQGAPRQLSSADRERIAEGYLRLYRFRAARNAANARFALVGARYFDAGVLPSELRARSAAAGPTGRLAAFRDRLRSAFVHARID